MLMFYVVKVDICNGIHFYTDACFSSDISVQPQNGAIACVGNTASLYCAVACSDNFAYPYGGDNDFRCADGQWLPMTIEDCYGIFSKVYNMFRLYYRT